MSILYTHLEITEFLGLKKGDTFMCTCYSLAPSGGSELHLHRVFLHLSFIYRLTAGFWIPYMPDTHEHIGCIGAQPIVNKIIKGWLNSKVCSYFPFTSEALHELCTCRKTIDPLVRNKKDKSEPNQRLYFTNKRIILLTFFYIIKKRFTSLRTKMKQHRMIMSKIYNLNKYILFHAIK